MTRPALCLVLLVGCATPMKALREDNTRLGKEVTELRDDRRAQDRKLRDLQHQLDKLRADRVSALVAQMPVLPVEVVGPAATHGAKETDGGRVVAIADDGTEIVYEGDAAAGKVATWGDEEPVVPRRARREAPAVVADSTSVPAGDRLEVTRRVPSMSARVNRTPMRDRDAAPTERSDAASADYRAAVELVKGGDQAAVASLRAFLTKYPRHDYADNAQYWLGEAFYAQKDYTKALVEFRNVIETYPRGNKVPDALLKVGFCYQAMGQGEKARAVLEQVVNLYPKTEPAALASKRLEGGT